LGKSIYLKNVDNYLILYKKSLLKYLKFIIRDNRGHGYSLNSKKTHENNLLSACDKKDTTIDEKDYISKEGANFFQGK